jgi:serine phosphatase RsbU (regulator of sigma subunit)
MVSVVCSNALNQSIEKTNSIDPAAILNTTRDLVKTRFKSESNNVKDGMDIALCSLNNEELKVQFSGANNPIYLIRNGELIETKGDKQHIGKHHKESPFNNHEIELQKNDTLYIFSDGYADQFGGPKGKKFMYKQFKALLLEIVDKPLETQKNILDQRLEEWKGNLEQIDDICIIGFKV